MSFGRHAAKLVLGQEHASPQWAEYMAAGFSPTLIFAVARRIIHH